MLSTHFPETLPMWKDIGTDVKKILLEDVIERLRDHQCSGVAEYVGSHQEEALKLLQIRFKSMKDRRRAKLRKQATEHEGLNPRFVSNHVANPDCLWILDSPANSATTASVTLATSSSLE